MLPSIVVEREVQLFQDERRCGAHLILPDQRRTQNANTALIEYPVRDVAAPVSLAERNPGDEELPGRVAPNVECWLVDAQEAQLDRSSRHRPPGQDCFNLRERQRRPSLYIGDTHIAQRQIGVDAVPAGFDATDTDRLAEMLADHLFDVGSIGLDIGQDAIAQQQHQCDEAEIDDPENPDQGAPKTRSVAAREERNQRVESVVKRWPQLFRAHHQTITCGSLCLSSGRVTRMACSIESVEGAIVPGNG